MGRQIARALLLTGLLTAATGCGEDTNNNNNPPVNAWTYPESKFVVDQLLLPTSACPRNPSACCQVGPLVKKLYVSSSDASWSEWLPAAPAVADGSDSISTCVWYCNSGGTPRSGLASRRTREL